MSLWKAIGVGVLTISGGVVLLVVTKQFFGGWLLQRSMKDTYDHVSQVTLGCAPGTSQVIEPWGKGGYSVSCRVNDVHDGPWQAWENGHIAITGAYASGKEHGTWFVYTNNGKQLYRTIVYENGAELSNVVH